MIRSSIYTGPRCTACVYSIYTPARCAPFPIMFPDSSVRTRRLHSLTQNRIPQLYRITDTLLRLQRSTFGFTPRDAARTISSNRFRRSTVRIDTEPTGRVQGRDFVRRTLSWFMVPLMAVAILGSDHAVQYFPMLPLSIRGAQFSYQQAVLGIRLELESHTEMFAGDIMTDPRGEETLYFSQRLQTAVLDGLSIRMPSLYMAINSWIETRFQLELTAWQQAQTPTISPPTLPMLDPTLRPDPHAAFTVRSQPGSNVEARNINPMQEPMLAMPVQRSSSKQPSTLEDPYAYRFGLNDPFQRHGPSPSMLSSHRIPQPVDTGPNFIKSMTRWANKVLNATSHAAASSGFVATELPPLPRKRQRDACSGASLTPLPRKAAQARMRNQRQLTNTDVPRVSLTESQVMQMVQTLESMQGPVSYQDTTLLPPVDEALAPSQQFLRDFQALHLPLPQSEPIPSITLPSSMFSSDPQSSNSGEHEDNPLNTRMNQVQNDRQRVRNAQSRVNRILRAAKETDNSQRLADRDVHERFGTDTDAAFIRGMVMQTTQIPAQHSERTSSLQSQPFRSDVNMADSALLPAPYPPARHTDFAHI